MSKGFICISTLDRIDELRKFLKSFLMHNSQQISVLFARNMEEAHRIKTQCAFLTPFDCTVLLDTDMLINGNLEELFRTAEKGKIGIARERRAKCINTGVIVFPKKLMMRLCEEWNAGFERKICGGFTGEWGTWDQDIFNVIIQKFPHDELASKWNHIIKDVSPEEEVRVYDDVRIFHFLHHPGVPREKYTSYQAYLAL